MVVLEFRPRHLARRFVRCLLVLTLFAAMPLLAHGATYYVNKSGRDSNTCAQATSQSTAKLTISSSLACMSGGDILMIGDGTYVESIHDAIPSGRAGAPTIVMAENRKQVILRPNAPTGAYVIAITSAASYITIDGITADGINTQNASYYISARSGEIHNVILKNGAAVNAKNSPVDGLPNGAFGPGILIGHHSNVAGHYNNQVLNMDVNDNEEHGIYISGHDNIIDGNRVYNSGIAGNHSDYSLSVYTTAGAGVDRNIIRNNVFANGADYGIIISTGTGNRFYNNVISGHPRYGLVLNYGSIGAEIYNNTIYGNGTSIIAFPGQVSGAIARNNICYGNGSDGIDDADRAVTASNNLFTNPLFVNAPAADFSLLSGSAAIGTGMDLSAVFTTDLVGKTREGTAWDIGAVGYRVVTQPVAPPTNLRVVGAQ